VSGLRRAFGGVVVLDAVTFAVAAGHAGGGSGRLRCSA
jgi:hypothetical protein